MAYHWTEQHAIALYFVSKRNWMTTPTYDLSAVLQCRTALRSFLFHSRSTLESDEQFSSPQQVPPLRSPLLGRISPSVSLLRHGIGWYCGFDGSKGPCQQFVLRESAGRPFSFSDSSLVGPRLLAAAVSCPRSLRVFFVRSSKLSLAVLAGLLPQLTTFNHCFTYVVFMQPT